MTQEGERGHCWSDDPVDVYRKVFQGHALQTAGLDLGSSRTVGALGSRDLSHRFFYVIEVLKGAGGCRLSSDFPFSLIHSSRHAVGPRRPLWEPHFPEHLAAG